jgi:hypothetical protein
MTMPDELGHLAPVGSAPTDEGEPVLVLQTAEAANGPLNTSASAFDHIQPPLVHTPIRILLYFSGRSEPLVISDTECVLGRTMEQDRSNTVDLSPYRAYALGVSRNHAALTYTPGGLTIKDLGSANGTWLNGMRLSGFLPYLLTDGDQIQLGCLLLTLRYIFNETLSH